MTVEDHQVSINKWTARVVPALIIGASGYVVFVVTKKICVDYLINPSNHGFNGVPKRADVATPILVFFFLLLVLYLSCYVRLMQTIAYNPGYTERIPHPQSQRRESKRDDAIKSCMTCVAKRGSEFGTYPQLNRTAILQGAVPAPPGLESFLSKDVFICDPQGLPLFCDMCNNWKPDRTHHCSEVERCVRRMDHFCPWVGGIVSETNIKFFIQFLFWAAGWGIYSLGFMAWALSDRVKRSDASQSLEQLPDGTGVINRNFDRIDGQWVAAIALTGLLGALFAGGMFLTTIYNAAVNRSTNEQVIKRSYNIAVKISRRNSSQYRGPTITYPLHASESLDQPRTYAIVQSKPSHNIWSITVIHNLKSVLGERYIDWWLPLRYPPCTRHNDPFSDYPLGPDFDRVCIDHGLR